MVGVDLLSSVTALARDNLLAPQNKPLSVTHSRLRTTILAGRLHKVPKFSQLPRSSYYVT
jgi:hypothetical protein